MSSIVTGMEHIAKDVLIAEKYLVLIKTKKTKNNP